MMKYWILNFGVIVNIHAYMFANIEVCELQYKSDAIYNFDDRSLL